MKLATETQTCSSSEECILQLPFGLIGLPKLTTFAFAPIENSWPFMSMNWVGNKRMNFVVIDPSGLIPGYDIELSDEDAESLQIESSEDVQILNIVTVHSSRPQFITVNLIGPIVINRQTGIGKQVIIQNWNRYSSEYPLVDQRAHKSAA
jgi:flagellar assembly factor FliW